MFIFFNSNYAYCWDYHETVLERSVEEVLGGKSELIFNLDLIPSIPIEGKEKYLEKNEYIVGERIHSFYIGLIRSNNISFLKMFINFTSPNGKQYSFNLSNPIFTQSDNYASFILSTGENVLYFDEPGFWHLDIKFISNTTFNIWEITNTTSNTCKTYLWHDFPNIGLTNIYRKGIQVFTNSEYLSLKSIAELNKASQALKDTAQFQKDSIGSAYCLVLVTAFLVIVTFILVIINIWHNEIIKKTYKPQISVALEKELHALTSTEDIAEHYYLSIQNDGQSIAKNVKLEMTPILCNNTQGDIKKTNLKDIKSNETKREPVIFPITSPRPSEIYSAIKTKIIYTHPYLPFYNLKKGDTQEITLNLNDAVLKN